MSELKFKPYARLLTMLGDQLIKNERVALVEVIKNSYDADADWVTVRFEHFTSNFEATSDSRIIIEDNGFGMTEETIKNHWINPATPNKLLGKKNPTSNPKREGHSRRKRNRAVCPPKTWEAYSDHNTPTRRARRA